VNTTRTVAHLTERYAETGETYVYEQALLARRHSSIFLSEVKQYNDFIPVEPYAYFRRALPGTFANRAVRFVAEKVAQPPYLALLNRFLASRARRAGAGLIHAHFGMMGFKALGTRRALKLPMITTFYGVDASQCVRSPYWIPRFQALFREGDLFVVLCEEVVERLTALGCPRDKIRVWDIGIPLDDYPYRAPRPTPSPKLLCVARFVEKKGYHVLLPAFQRLVTRHPGTTLTIAGHGPLKADVERLVVDLGLSGRVTMVDTTAVADFFAFFKRALDEHDLFVLPSVVARNGDDESGPPVVLTNAMAVGLPIVSTPVGGIPRAIRDGDTGVLTAPNDVEDLAAKISALIDQPDRWRGLSQRARALAEDRFNLTRQIEKLEEMYDEFL